MAPGRMGMSAKRIGKELRDLEGELPQGIRAGLKNTDNLFEWYAQVEGPEESVYEGGVFDIDISIPNDYPFRPPKATFKTKVYHMNINAQGGICLDILKNQWSPALSILKVILSILSLLTDPNPSDPLVGEIAQMYMRNRPLHDKNARQTTKLSARPELAWPPVQSKSEVKVLAGAGSNQDSSSTTCNSKSLKGKGKEDDSEIEVGKTKTADDIKCRESDAKERIIVIDEDDDDGDVQFTNTASNASVVGSKRPNPDGANSEMKTSRRKVSSDKVPGIGTATATPINTSVGRTSMSRQGSSSTNTVIELD